MKAKYMIADFDNNSNSLARKERAARLALELCDDLSKFERAIYNIEVCYELYEKYPTDSAELQDKVCYRDLNKKHELNKL